MQGKLTVKGVTKDVSVPVSFTHLADKLSARVGDPKVKGDLLVLRATFDINRSGMTGTFLVLVAIVGITNARVWWQLLLGGNGAGVARGAVCRRG